ncbi:hypothetical protein [Thermococcus sibiricus]|uniref:hypothetical protein n=1 Tax=Thermococcus sibiricus TaxID=172049 RepID=UPI00064E482A|nr:hypothetical protein [Thermococcus sibiricus]
MVLSLFLSFLRLMWILPKMLWQFAGMKRAIKRGKRKFKKALVKNGFPKELAEELANDYAILDEMLSFEGILKLVKTSWRTERNIPAFLKVR